MIDFSQDPRVTAALQQWRGRAVFPTDLGSADLRGFSSQLHLRSIFSARTTNADYLQEVGKQIDDVLAGRSNLATARWRLMQKLAQLGYDPAVGFPQDMATIPPAERGSLQDLSSKRRLDLMLKTNIAVARNFGRAQAGNTEFARHAWPAWELVRLESREVERGTEESHTDGWQKRFARAVESVQLAGVSMEASHQGRMVARKDSPVWQALANGAGGYTDTLGHPWPPFAFNSGMDWRAVKRAEWLALEAGGTPAPAGETPAPQKRSLAPSQAEVVAAYYRLAPDLQAALKARLAA